MSARDTHIILFLSPYYSIPVFLTVSPIILNIVSYYSQVNDLSKIKNIRSDAEEGSLKTKWKITTVIHPRPLNK